MNNLSQFFKVVTIAHFALMHTLQNPNVLTPCIRLSAVAPQPRAAVRALRGHPGEKGEDRDSGTSPGPQWRLGRARRGTAKAVTRPQGSLAQGGGGTGGKGRGRRVRTTGDAASLHPRLGPRAARRRADRLGCESEESEPRRRQSRRQGGVGGRAVTQPEAWQPWLPRDPRPWHSCCESCCS